MKTRTLIVVVLAVLAAVAVVGLVGRDRDAMAALVGQVTPLSDNALAPPPNSTVPKVTEAEKAMAVDIALKDGRVKELLAGKKYVIAPDGGAGPEIGVWHQGNKKLGVAFVIKFDKTYDLDYQWPTVRWRDEGRTGFVTERRPAAAKAGGILVCVNLYVDTKDGSTLDIRPM